MTTGQKVTASTITATVAAGLLALLIWAGFGIVHHYQARSHSDGLCTYTSDGVKYKAECPPDYSGGN